MILYTGLPLAVIAAAAGVVSAWTSVSFWAVFVVGVAAVLANGFLATLEDDLPGGFNNPDGTSTPKYARVVSGVVRWLVASLCLVLAAGFVWVASEYVHRSDKLVGAGIAVLSASAALLLVRKRRWALAGAGVAVAALLAAALL